eukprot:PITA_33545
MVEGMSNSSFYGNFIYGKQNQVILPSGVFDKFKEFKALVENQTEKKIKVLRTDNGREFCRKEFEEFCKKFGIAREKSSPYTLEQNGVVERMNKTLMERARSMLNGARLGQELWVESVEIACNLFNRSPSSALEDNTPQEVWTGKKPSLSHLKVFECHAYVYLPKEKRTNLDSKSENCIFIGTVKEARDLEDGKLWKEAMVDEISCLHKNEAWDLVELLARRKPIGNKCVFKKKTNAKGKVEKYEAQLVEKGYSQVPGIDFGDIFSPVAKITSIRLLLFVATAFYFEVE